jgi:alanyl-tRNA synthetase
MTIDKYIVPVTKVFWDDAYLTRLQTEITAVSGDQVRLRATNFFAFSGGQESDAGTIGGRSVLKAEKDRLDIVYTLAPEHGLSAGDPVEVVIDWVRRYSLMRHHFAAEMVLQLVCKFRPRIFHQRRRVLISHTSAT